MPEPCVDILGMGIVPLDYLYTVASLPRAGQKIDAGGLTIQGGGPIPNVLVGLSRLGYATSIISAIGDDDIGRRVRRELCDEEVACDNLIAKRQPSATAVGFVEQASGRRTMVLHRQIGVRADDLRTAKLPTPEILILDGRDPGATLRLAKWGRRRGAIVVLEIGSEREEVTLVFPFVDHFVVSDAYAYPTTKSRSPQAALKRLRERIGATILLTAGTKGAYGLAADRVVHCPAFRVDVTDTTGAGDAFLAGYCHGLLTKQGLPERLRLGAAMAAIKCGGRGARTNLPTLAKLRRFLAGETRTYA